MFLRAVSRVLVGAAAAACLAAAPALAAIAAADPGDWPAPGSQPASDTLMELERQGYAVGINWLDGSKSVPLSRCRVTGYHAPAGDAGPQTGTVYMDVICPYED